MNICCVNAHPDNESLSSAATERIHRAIAGLSQACIQDIHLYNERFDPILSLSELRQRFSMDEQTQKYIKFFQQSSLIVCIYPEWWGGPPAILKGLFDRVFRPEIAYRMPEISQNVRRRGYEQSSEVVGLWKDKSIQLIITTDSSVEDCGRRAKLIFSSISEFCGIRMLPPLVFGPVYGSSQKSRKNWLDDVESTISGLIHDSV